MKLGKEDSLEKWLKDIINKKFSFPPIWSLKLHTLNFCQEGDTVRNNYYYHQDLPLCQQKCSKISHKQSEKNL